MKKAKKARAKKKKKNRSRSKGKTPPKPNFITEPEHAPQGRDAQQFNGRKTGTAVSSGGRAARQFSGALTSATTSHAFSFMSNRNKGGNWTQFAKAFNGEFKSILHAFGLQKLKAPKPEEEAAPAKKGKGPEYESLAEARDAVGNAPKAQSGLELNAMELKRLFTNKQRDKINAFITSRYIPERLFNGDSVGNATAQQRLLISSHILTYGKFRPGRSFDQKVHARMCYHWAQTVHNYAGVTPAEGGLAKGVKGQFDHNTNVVFGSGKEKNPFQEKGVKAANLPKKETPGELGPIPTDSLHAAALDRENERVENKPGSKRSIHRRPAYPLSKLETLQPGDWLWYYNANSSGGGSHSVIFSRWAGPVKEVAGVKYRTAIVFSQRRTYLGGLEHKAHIGEQYYNNASIKITPITSITRVAKEARPAQTVDELLIGRKPKSEQKLRSDNKKYLRKLVRGKKYKGKRINIDALMDHMRGENLYHIASLSGNVTKKQIQLLHRANNTQNFETLVRLTQKLRAYARNLAILKRNRAKVYSGKINLNEKYKKIKAEVAASIAKFEEDLAKINQEMEGLEDHESFWIQHLASVNLKPQARILRRQWTKLGDKLKTLNKGTTEYALVRNERIQLRTAIRALDKEHGSLSQERTQALRALRKLRSSKSTLKWKKKALWKKRLKVERELPFGSVHPGNITRGALSGKTNGVIEGMYSANFIRKNFAAAFHHAE